MHVDNSEVREVHPEIARARRTAAEGSSDAYSAALERLHHHGPSLVDGLFSHAPMVVDALVELGGADRISDWVDGQAHGFTPRPPTVAAIDENDPCAALGQRDRFADWSDYFMSEFESNGWRVTLDPWICTLAPGFTTAACHALIRTAHAVRALERRDDLRTQRELAEGLASWASMYFPLPFEAKPPRDALDPRTALAQISPVAPDHRPTQGMIVAGYFALLHCPGFADEVAAVDLRGDLQDIVDELVVVFADLFVRRAHSPFLAIVFAHAVTGAAAVGHIARVVSDATARTLLYRAWEGGCALEGAFGVEAAGGRPSLDALDAVALRCAAIDHGDDHVVKLTEACLTTWARRPEAALLEAAAVVRQRI